MGNESLQALTLGQILDRTVAAHGDRDAMIYVDRSFRLTYSEFAEVVEQLLGGNTPANPPTNGTQTLRGGRTTRGGQAVGVHVLERAELTVDSQTRRGAVDDHVGVVRRHRVPEPVVGRAPVFVHPAAGVPVEQLRVQR